MQFLFAWKKDTKGAGRDRHAAGGHRRARADGGTPDPHAERRNDACCRPGGVNLRRTYIERARLKRVVSRGATLHPTYLAGASRPAGPAALPVPCER